VDGAAGTFDRDAAFQAAVARQRAGDNAAAIGLYQRVLAADPVHAGAWINLGVALRAAGRIAAAVACLRRGVALRPDDAAARSNLGNALRADGRLDEARACHEAAIAAAPASGSFVYNLALVLRDAGDLDAALARFDAAETLGYDKSELKWDRALALLLRGDMARGFTEYEWRWQTPDAKKRDFPGPAWDGAPLGDGTLLVYAEQGFGDAIQFVRYLPLLAGRAARVVFECPALLIRLLRASPACAGLRLVARDIDPLPDFDAHAALLSLPHLLTAETIPAQTPYLHPPAEGTRLDDPPGGGLRVGIAWAGKPTHRNDRNRSLALARLAPVLELPGADFHSLQLGAAADQIAALGFAAVLRDWRPQIRDFADSAALIAALDLVITVDSAPAHLAGALGREVWTLLPFAPDWRWRTGRTGRTDTPWYPAMRLFRQDAPGAWDEVVARVCAALAARIEKAAR